MASGAAVDGMSNPSAPITAMSPPESTKPSAIPRIDATRATSNASMTTIQMTWLPVAPTARSNANSFWRCLTMMRNVF